MGCASFQEALIIILVVTVVLGASRLPQIGEGLGRAIRNFRHSVKGDEIDVTPEDPKQVPPTVDSDQQP